MADKNIDGMQSSDSESADLERKRQSMFNAVLVKRKKGTEEDRCSRVQEYLDEGVDVNALDEDRNTVLHIAVKKGFSKVVKLLLGKGALTDIENTQGDTAISMAEKLGEKEIAAILKASNGGRHERLPSATQSQRSDDHGHGSRSASSSQGPELVKSNQALTLGLAIETQGASCSGFRESSSEEDQPRNKNEKDIAQKPRWDIKDTYNTSASTKNNAHGFMYHWKHLVLALNYAWQKNYAFRLATEFTSAGKFDDLFFEYEDREGKRTHYFVQLKHKLDSSGSQRITAGNLLADEKGDFGMQKYFHSWFKNKTHQGSSESMSKCYILCTNIVLDTSDLKNAQIEVIEAQDDNEFLNITDSEKQGSRYKLRPAKNSKLYKKLESASELNQLAKALAKCVNDSNESPLRSDTFQRYYTALTREVLGIGDKKHKFTDAFIKNDDKLSPGANKFRGIFFTYVKEFRSKKNESVREEDILTNLKNMSFTTSMTSGESTTGSQQNRLPDLPDDQMSDEDISDFLDEFILAVNQPNEQKLGESIKRVFGENSPFNLSNTDFVVDSLQIMTLDWFKQDEYLVREDIETFFGEMKRKISSLITVGLNLHYLSELKKYNVQFKSEMTNLRIVLGSSNSTANLICQVIPSEQTLLTALRVYQTLDQTEEYKKDDSFIFIKLEKFLLPEITRQVFLAFLSSGSQRLLAIDCGLDSTRQDMEQLQKNVDEIVTKLHEDKITGKRIILIHPKKDARVIQTKQDHTIPEIEGDVSIDNIENATQRKLLKRKIIRFQEREEKISFMDLFGIDNFDDAAEKKLADCRGIISPKTLVSLIRSKELPIGGKWDGLGKVAEFYIPRTIDRRVVINHRILLDTKITDMFAISGIVAEALEKLLTSEKRQNEISDQTTPNYRAKYILLEQGRETEHFDRVCQSHPNLNIHWLRREHEQFIWMRSYRNITNLLGYRDETRRDGDDNGGHGVIQLSEKRLAEYDEQRKIVVLSDTAGMGKSTVLTRLAEQIRENEPCLLVIKIDLTSCTTVLASEKNERSFSSNKVNGAVDFLVDKLISNLTPEEVSLYKTIIKVERKVVILFDGFDEISPDYTETVIDLLQALAKHEVKQLFVTTRPHTSRALEEKLEVFADTLRPFSSANQIRFLTKFWKTASVIRNLDSNSLKKKDLKEHAQNVIKLLAQSIDPSMAEFTGVPLQTRLVAEVFPFEGSLVPKKITIIEMYKKFVDKKYDVYSLDKRRANPTIPANKSTDWESRGFLMMHERVALNLLFDRTTVAKLLPTQGVDFDDTLEDMVKDQERTGIVTLQRDGQFRFIHRTFAEYFAATCLIKMLRNDACDRAAQEFFVGQLFVQSEYRVIRAFLNCLMVDQNWEGIGRDWGESWEFDMREHRNPEGETAYHVAARERHAPIVKFLSNNVREHHEALFSNMNCPSINKKGETPLIVAVQILDNFDVVKCLIDSGAAVDGAVMYSEEFTYISLVPLHYAASSGDLDCVKYLAESGADIDAQTVYSGTPLLRAAESGHLEVVKYLAESGADINAQGTGGDTPLLRAAYSGHLEMVKYLAESGANVNAETGDGDTPLLRAAMFGHLEMVKYLAESGADINAENVDSRTPLLAAAESGHLEVVKYLAASGVDINAQGTDGDTPLLCAATRGHLEVVKYLAESGADINAQGMEGETPLLRAAYSGRLKVVKYIVESGADINAQRRNGETPLLRAVSSGHLEVVKYLAESGADVNAQTTEGDTPPLLCGGGSGQLKVVKYLAASGVDINAQGTDGDTPLLCAATRGHLEVVKYLAERWVDINAQTTKGATPLLRAAGSGHLEVVKYLKASGADVNAQTTNGDTPLLSAVGSGHLEVVKYLAEGGADVNAQTTKGATPLLRAAGSGHLEMVQYLAGKEANIHVKNEYGNTALQRAAAYGHLEVVKYLKEEQGADIHVKNKYGNTPLMLAAWCGHLEVVKYLPKREEDINAQNTDGDTPLLGAARSGHLEVVKYLKEEQGADIDVKNRKGNTPLMFAAWCGHLEVVKYLADRGVDINATTKDGETPLLRAASYGRLEVVKYLSERGADMNGQTASGDTALLRAASSGNLDLVK